MNNICTSLEQSKKLIELGIDIDTADMGWNVFVDDTIRLLPIDDWDLVKDGSGNVKFYPAWSLVALLNVLPYPSLHKTVSCWRCDFYNKEGTSCKLGESLDNPIDTAFEMVVWFLKNKKL